MMQKVRSQAFALRRIALELLVGMRFQVLLTPLTGVLFTFPSRYLFTIGLRVVFSLTRWSWQIQAGFHVSRLTWVPDSGHSLGFAYGTVTLYGPTFPEWFALSEASFPGHPYRAPQPRLDSRRPVWALPLSLATTNGITACFLFLRVLRCFTSPGSLLQPMYSGRGVINLRSRLRCHSRRMACRRVRNRSVCSSTHTRPRVNRAPAPALCCVRRRSTSVVQPT